MREGIKKRVGETSIELVEIGFDKEFSEKLAYDMVQIGNINIEGLVRRCIDSIKNCEIPSYLKVEDWHIVLKVLFENDFISKELYKNGVKLKKI